MNAIRIAADIGLVHVTLRPMNGAKNRTNIIAIVDPAVIAWIKRGPRRPHPDGSGQKIDPHVCKDSKTSSAVLTRRTYT